MTNFNAHEIEMTSRKRWKSHDADIGAADHAPGTPVARKLLCKFASHVIVSQ